MTMEKALRLKMNWKVKSGNTPCLHRRMVDVLCLTGRVTSQLLGCCECGTIISAPMLKKSQTNFTKESAAVLAYLS